MATPRVQVNVRLTPELRDAIDARRAQVGQSRDTWIANALTHVLTTTQPANTTGEPHE